MSRLSVYDALVPLPRDGSPGEPSVRYWLVPSVTQVVRSSLGVCTPSEVSCKKMKQAGNGPAQETGELVLKYQLSTGGPAPYTHAVSLESALWLRFFLYRGDVLYDSVTVPVVSDGKDGLGERGPLPYPAGIYQAEVSYTSTRDTTPVVYYEPGRTFYVMNRAGTVQGLDPAEDYAGNGSGATWLPFENYRAVFTELLMANLGLIGKSVFFGEYMFSQYGKQGEREVAQEGQYDIPVDAGGSFDPHLLINFLTGYLRCNNVDIRGIINALSGSVGGWKITDEGIESEEVTQTGEGVTGRNRTCFKKDGTISGNLLNVGLLGGLLRCGLYRAPLFEWEKGFVKFHSRVAHPFELTSSVMSGSSGDLFHSGLDKNSLIIQPSYSNLAGKSQTVYYDDLPNDLEKYEGVTLRIYNPGTRPGTWKPNPAAIRYKLNSWDTSFTPFLGKYTGTALSIPAGKMVVITGVRETVSGGDFGDDRLKWYVEVTA